jgi:hypothetical protein
VRREGERKGEKVRGEGWGGMLLMALNANPEY